MTSPPEAPPPVDRRSRLAALLAVPTVLVAVGIATVEGARLSRPNLALFSTPFVYSLAEAIEGDDLDSAIRFIRAGQDPNEPIEVRHAVLTGGQSALVAPLLWAVARERPRSVLLLLGFGARLDTEAGRRAVCLAAAGGHEELARLLARHAPTPPSEPDACLDGTLGSTPLLSLIPARK